MLLAATLAATLAVAGGSRSVRAPAPRCAAAAASETLSRHELRERRRRTRLLAAELSALDVQGSAPEREEIRESSVCVAHAETAVPAGVLEACSIHGLDRQRLLAFSRLAALEQTAPAPTSASASSPADGDAGSVGDAGSDPNPRCEGEGGGDTLELSVPDSLDGSRVDAALAALLPPLSRSYFGGLAADGHVLVGGGRVKKVAGRALLRRLRRKRSRRPAARVCAGDSLKVWLRAERELSLVYLAVCVGEPHSRAVIDAPIGRHTTDRLRMAVRRGDGADAREALSVLGDPLYGDANWNRLEARTARRPLLHARELRLAHPHSGELLHAVAPAPDDLAAYGARLAGVSPDRFDAWAREATDAVLAEARDSFEYC
ncbi:hypothetical protein EMIHUDRAFT_200027 [Emiliania huxleyi CCMP1516]|uniref:Pseudouridine synthase RsuA/RluA-like domain-containing protein n=2 Tax=Emiliania huxleyi TaxID=2903 RepID=A0A0D3KUU7_EMIH1|nr:hypothetical protein EMIHUDRAFT_200027 [Emiliania huxleyi CCMP1516]EOD39532.1 hypothetical protein EMIHUDRAFT_200027 [Emiliania huxleyi CCMP1516]|eukprot:XP_005791961.1 hypothetical protein EMIHUDRAFT_200027 [Emiliania huxleyi CCMP1516]